MGGGNSFAQDASSRVDISCPCGNVIWRTREAVPRTHYECACRDCSERLEWAVSQGAQSTAITDQGPAHMVQVGNSFTEIVGKENLKLYKVRADSKATMFVADCCKSVMTLLHPAMGNNLAGFCGDLCKINSPKYELTNENMLCRWHTRSWDKKRDAEAYDELPPFSGGP